MLISSGREVEEGEKLRRANFSQWQTPEAALFCLNTPPLRPCSGVELMMWGAPLPSLSFHLRPPTPGANCDEQIGEKLAYHPLRSVFTDSQPLRSS